MTCTTTTTTVFSTNFRHHKPSHGSLARRKRRTESDRQRTYIGAVIITLAQRKVDISLLSLHIMLVDLDRTRKASHVTMESPTYCVFQGKKRNIATGLEVVVFQRHRLFRGLDTLAIQLHLFKFKFRRSTGATIPANSLCLLSRGKGPLLSEVPSPRGICNEGDQDQISICISVGFLFVTEEQEKASYAIRGEAETSRERQTAKTEGKGGISFFIAEEYRQQH
ncbi:hypothetical protein Ancab_017248 [Ancistrocladus abbreviatus]